MIKRDAEETTKLVWEARKNGETLDAVGKRIGLSREQVRQYEWKALKEMSRLAALEEAGGLNPDTPLALSGLPTRAFNCCQNEGLKTVADLKALKGADLLRFSNFGKRSFEAIERLVAQVYGEGFEREERQKPGPKPKAERKAREPKNGWRLIDTAPTDGSYFLAYIPWRGIEIIKWEGDPKDLKVVWRSNCRVAIGGKPGFRPSHWMPLPKEP